MSWPPAFVAGGGRGAAALPWLPVGLLPLKEELQGFFWDAVQADEAVVQVESSAELLAGAREFEASALLTATGASRTPRVEPPADLSVAGPAARKEFTCSGPVGANA